MYDDIVIPSFALIAWLLLLLGSYFK